MDKRFKAKMFHRKGKALAKVIRAQMHPDDVLFYYRSFDDDSGVVMKRSRVRLNDTSTVTKEDLQLALPLYQTPILSNSLLLTLRTSDIVINSYIVIDLNQERLFDVSTFLAD